MHRDILFSHYFLLLLQLFVLFFFNDTATTEIYTLSLHDALPILFAPGLSALGLSALGFSASVRPPPGSPENPRDRKSTRLNSSHVSISYAVFCLKKKNSAEATQASTADAPRRRRRARRLSREVST